MKLLPCARKISATSTVGRFTRPSSCGDWVSRQALRWREHRRDCEWIEGAAATDGDKLSLLPSRRDPEAFESFLGRCRVLINGLPSCDVYSACGIVGTIPSSRLLPSNLNSARIAADDSG